MEKARPGTRYCHLLEPHPAPRRNEGARDLRVSEVLPDDGPRQDVRVGAYESHFIIKSNLKGLAKADRIDIVEHLVRADRNGQSTGRHDCFGSDTTQSEYGDGHGLGSNPAVCTPYPPRSLPVAPLIRNQRCYGEATVRLR